MSYELIRVQFLVLNICQVRIQHLSHDLNSEEKLADKTESLFNVLLLLFPLDTPDFRGPGI